PPPHPPPHPLPHDEPHADPHDDDELLAAFGKRVFVHLNASPDSADTPNTATSSATSDDDPPEWICADRKRSESNMWRISPRNALPAAVDRGNAAFPVRIRATMVRMIRNCTFDRPRMDATISFTIVKKSRMASAPPKIRQRAALISGSGRRCSAASCHSNSFV